MGGGFTLLILSIEVQHSRDQRQYVNIHPSDKTRLGIMEKIAACYMCNTLPRWGGGGEYYCLKQFFIDGNWGNMYAAQFSHSESYLCSRYSATSRRPICHKRAGTSSYVNLITVNWPARPKDPDVASEDYVYISMRVLFMRTLTWNNLQVRST